MSEYEFDAHIVVEAFKTKEGAAAEILGTLVDAGIACSLHEAGTLNVKAKDAEIERLTAERKELEVHWYNEGKRIANKKIAKLQAVVDYVETIDFLQQNEYLKELIAALEGDNE